MSLEDIGLPGWLHTLACIAALVAGGWNSVMFDRGRWHQLRGDIYVWSMIVANVLVFVIYDFDIDFIHGKIGPGVLGFFHWLAIAALVSTIVGWFAARRQRHGVWAYTHPIAMALSYYTLLGGLVNELFARVEALRPLATTMVNGQPRFGSPIVGMSQSAVMVASAILILIYVVRVFLRRRKRKQGRKASAGPMAA
jgi:hypothetical protein